MPCKGFTHLKEHHTEAPHIRVERVWQPRINFGCHILEGARAAIFVPQTWDYLDSESEIDILNGLAAATGCDQNIILCGTQQKQKRIAQFT